MKTKPALALLAFAALLSTASILAGLRHKLTRHDKPAPSPADEPHEDERARIRAALADILAPPIDFSLYPEHLRPRRDLPDRDTLRKRIKPNPRPAWHDIREDRDAGW